MEVQGPGRPEDVAEEDTRDHKVSEFTRKILEAAEHGRTAAPPGAHPVDALPSVLACLVWRLSLAATGLAAPAVVSFHTQVSGLSASRSHACASTVSLGFRPPFGPSFTSGSHLFVSQSAILYGSPFCTSVPHSLKAAFLEVCVFSGFSVLSTYWLCSFFTLLCVFVVSSSHHPLCWDSPPPQALSLPLAS